MTITTPTTDTPPADQPGHRRADARPDSMGEWWPTRCSTGERSTSARWRSAPRTAGLLALTLITLVVSLYTAGQTHLPPVPTPLAAPVLDDGGYDTRSCPCRWPAYCASCREVIAPDPDPEPTAALILNGLAR